jgi:hypothetical protein
MLSGVVDSLDVEQESFHGVRKVHVQFYDCKHEEADDENVTNNCNKKG